LQQTPRLTNLLEDDFVDLQPFARAIVEEVEELSY